MDGRVVFQGRRPSSCLGVWQLSVGVCTDSELAQDIGNAWKPGHGCEISLKMLLYELLSRPTFCCKIRIRVWASSKLPCKLFIWHCIRSRIWKIDAKMYSKGNKENILEKFISLQCLNNILCRLSSTLHPAPSTLHTHTPTRTRTHDFCFHFSILEK